MKTLNTYINEWKASPNTVSSIKKTQYFVYKLDERSQIRIFDEGWLQLKNYKDKVYINGEKTDLNDNGLTIKKYEPGIYNVEIKSINDVKTCEYMFCNCKQLVAVPSFDTSKIQNMSRMFFYCNNLKKVPLFDTSNVEYMCNMFSDCYEIEEVPNFDTKNVIDVNYMFSFCKKLKEVPLFDVRNVKNMKNMFLICNNLSEGTKQKWSKIYDFEKNDKKI